jgi:hypothetical protein
VPELASTIIDGTGDPTAEGAVPYVTSLSALSQLAATTGTCSLVLGLRSGMFRWNNTDLSAMVAVDTAQGMYVAPESDGTGASGAWVRETTDIIDPRWFGLEVNRYIAEVPASFTAASSTLSLVAALPVDVTGWYVAYRKGNSGTLADATLAPFAAEERTVAAYAIGSNMVTLSATASITATAATALDATTGHYEDGGAAIFYQPQTSPLQIALTLGHLLGLTVQLPEGDLVTDELFLLDNLTIDGGARDRAKLYLRACQAFVNSHRTSVLSPNNIDLVTQRHNRTDSSGNYIPVSNVKLRNFSVYGHGYFQNPLGPNYTNGNFALHNINCIFVENWEIDNVHSEDAMGDGCYLGSRTVPAGTTDYTLVSSKRVKITNSVFKRNWRLAHQRGNVIDTVIEDTQYIDNNLGWYHAVTRLGGSHGTYSPECIDAEANVGVGMRSVWNRCTFTSLYGKVIDMLWESTDLTFENCLFKDCIVGGITQSPVSDFGAHTYVGEGLTVRNCIFQATSAAVEYYLVLRHSNAKIIGNKFRGQCANGSPAILLDSINDTADTYTNQGTIFSDNYFDIGTSEIRIDVGSGAAHQVRDGVWQDSNVIKSGQLSLRQGFRSRQELSAIGVSTARSPAPWTASANGGSGAIWQTAESFGLGANPWSLMVRFWGTSTTGYENPINLVSASGVELALETRVTINGPALRLALNPGGGGLVNYDFALSDLGEMGPAFGNKSRPIDLAISCTGTVLTLYIDGQILTSITLARAFSTSGLTLQAGRGVGGPNLRLYEVSLYNKAVSAKEARAHRLFGPANADRWGIWGSTSGCVLNCMLDAGIGFQCFDRSDNRTHFYSGAAIKWDGLVRRGVFSRRWIQTGSGNTRMSDVASNYFVQPARSVVRRAWALQESGTATIKIGTSSGGAELVAAVALTAGYQEFQLVSSGIYASADRPLFLNFSAQATATWGVEYELVA